MSTAGRSRHRMMRTCSAFGGLVRSSGASAVAGASSASITTGADGGLRRQAPMVSPSGCQTAARVLGWAALGTWTKALGKPDKKWAQSRADAPSMGVRHQEEGGYVPSQVFAEAKSSGSTKSISFTSLYFSLNRPPPRQIHSALQNEAVHMVSSRCGAALAQSRRRAVA